MMKIYGKICAVFSYFKKKVIRGINSGKKVKKL